MHRSREMGGRKSDSLDVYELGYERYSETKKERTHIHRHSRDLWVRICDAFVDIRRRTTRSRRARHAAVPVKSRHRVKGMDY